MRNKLLLRLACPFFAVALGLGAISVSAESADKVKIAHSGIIDFNLQRSGADNVQDLIIDYIRNHKPVQIMDNVRFRVIYE